MQVSLNENELFHTLESTYDNDGLHSMYDLLCEHNLGGYRTYIPFFIRGLSSSQAKVRHFAVCILIKFHDIEDRRLETEYPYLEEYDYDEYEYEYWYNERKERIDSTFKWIWNYINSNKVLDTLKLLASSKNQISKDAIRTVSHLAYHRYLDNDDCHRFIFSILEKNGRSHLRECLESLFMLQFPSDKEYAQKFGDMLMQHLHLSSLDQYFSHPQRIIADMIFRYSDLVEEYLWSVEEHTKKLVALLDNISDFDLKIKYIENTYRGGMAFEKYVLSDIMKNGFEQNELSQKYFESYVKDRGFIYSKHLKEINNFMLHVLFTWTKDISSIVWKSIISIELEHDVFQRYDFFELDDDLQKKYIRLLLDVPSNKGNRELIELYNSGEFKLLDSGRNEIWGSPFYELGELLESIHKDESGFVLNFIISVVREHSGSWDKNIRDRCKSYLESHHDEEAKKILSDPTISWAEVKDYFRWDMLL